MSARIPEKVRSAVVDEVSSGKKRSAVARRHNISQASVARICRDSKIIPLRRTPGQAASVQAATESMQLEARHRRAALALNLLGDAERLRAQLWTPTKVYDFGGREYGYVEKEIAEPDFRGKRDLMIAIAVAVDKSIAIERHDAESSNGARAAIIDLFDRMAAEETKTHITIEEH